MSRRDSYAFSCTLPCGLAGRALLVLALVIATLWAPLPVLAQDADSDSEAAADEETFGEEVTVTARKREETVQEVPFSLVAPTEEDLRKRGAMSLEDVAANVAGFNVQNLGPGQSQVAIRGVSAGQIARDQPGVKEQVGVYLDDSVISLSLFTPGHGPVRHERVSRCCAARRGPCSAPAR